MEQINQGMRPTTIKEQVYIGIKNRILDGTFKQGERLHEVNLSKMFNVSRSPVREAIIELVTEGLLESIPNKGVYVKKLSVSDIINIYELREVLEQYAIRKSIEKINEDDIRKLEEIRYDLIRSFEENDLETYIKVDTNLHNIFFEICDNDILNDIIGSLYPQIQTFRSMSLSKKDRFEQSLEEHLDIINGLINRDFDKAWNGASKNLSMGRDEIVKNLETL